MILMCLCVPGRKRQKEVGSAESSMISLDTDDDLDDEEHGGKDLW